MSVAEPNSSGETQIDLSFVVNGQTRALSSPACETLLDVLRDGFGLTGVKKGCDMGACGACTVLVNGQAIKSCLALAASYAGQDVITIEGLVRNGRLHPLQDAFVRHDALQCGYCTPGQILAGIALIDEGAAKTREAIREAMSGNLCRCGAYPNIVDAIAEVAGL